ncbi:MAG TPA: Rid family hydrolase [Conexibacter sp.]|jgi:enamine deaminase RidA (YjgF/YER057c/UK114 family)
MNIWHDTGVAQHLGGYSDAVEVQEPASWLLLSGTPGVAADGTVPERFAKEAENAWANVKRALDVAGFELADLVKVTQYLTSAEDVEAYTQVRAAALGDARPAFMLLVVPELIRPDVRVQIEALAAKPKLSHTHKDAQQLAREALGTSDLGYRDSDEQDAYEHHASGS